MTVPRPVRQAATAVLVVAAVHVLALVLLVVNRHALLDAATAQHPDWTAARLRELADGRFFQSAVPHVVLPVILTVRALALRSGRSRRRVFLTVLLCIQLAAHATFPLQRQMLPSFTGWLLLVQGFSLVFELAALVLLWAPAESRRWFTAAQPTADVAGQPALIGR
jgi:hypothetical protein